ncbi:MAG: hypothetical protein QXG39_09260 [Candidatus Aenigmatarchaeota archaeon]
MKSIAIITIPILGLIATLTIVASVAVFFYTVKYHLEIIVEEEYDYNNAQLALLSLISHKYNETYSMYRLISERDLNGFDEDMKSELGRLIKITTFSDCVKISNQTSIIFEMGNCKSWKNEGWIYIFKPYNKESLVEKLVMVYEERGS